MNKYDNLCAFRSVAIGKYHKYFPEIKKDDTLQKGIAQELCCALYGCRCNSGEDNKSKLLDLLQANLKNNNYVKDQIRLRREDQSFDATQSTQNSAKNKFCRLIWSRAWQLWSDAISTCLRSKKTLMVTIKR